MQNLENIFYTYIYLNPLKPGKFEYDTLKFDYEPFYAGKGKGKRMFCHYTVKHLNIDPNKHKTNTIKQILNDNKLPIIIKFSIGTHEQEAFDNEIYLIKTIGRNDLQLGPLLNLTNGGDGCVGHEPWNKGKELSESTKNKISQTLKDNGLWKGDKNPSKTDEHKKRISFLLKGKKHTEEAKKKMSIGSTGIRHTEETKKKITETLKTKSYLFKTQEFRDKISRGNLGKTHDNMDKLHISLGRIDDKIKYLNNIIYVKKNINFTTNELMQQTSLTRTLINRIKTNKHCSAFLTIKQIETYKQTLNYENIN